MTTWLQTLDGQKHQLGDSKPASLPCFRCGQCCTDLLVKLDGADLKLLLSGLKIVRRELFRKYVRETPIGLVLRQDGRKCVFLKPREDHLTGCSVYDLRPEVCRNYTPSLFREECLKGLQLLGDNGKVLLPGEMYQNKEDLLGLQSAVAGRRNVPEIVL